MIIEITLPHVFSPSSSEAEDAEVLRVLLETLIAIDRVYVRRRAAPTLYQSGVVYGRTRTWDPIPSVSIRGYGDCKSLVAWRIAELREAGIDCRPVFRFKTRASGAKDFHILIAKPGKNGKIEWEDPSKILGMGKNENAPIREVG